MPAITHPTRPSFEENLSSLSEELLLAAKWDRPSILLAVHKTKFGQEKAQAALEQRLAALGERVIRITVDGEHTDVPHIILQTPSPTGSVFFISNLDWGSGEDRRDAYRALNIYREFFVEHRLRAVVWLTVNEAAKLARFAPDFWAFRHRVIEFSGERIPRKINLAAGALLWDIQNSVDPFDSLTARVQVREELLARLPNTTEAQSARCDLLHQLGHLCWLLDDQAAARERFEQALQLAPRERARRTRASILNGQAIAAYEASDVQGAAAKLQEARELSPGDAQLMVNESIVVSALGRNTEAMTIAARAAKAGGSDARILGGLGYLFASLGKPDEAILHFTRALESAPRNAACHAAMAIAWDLVERPDKADLYIESARQLAQQPLRTFLDIYEAALEGDTHKAVAIGRSAIAERRLLPQELRRDPNISLLLEPEQIKALIS